VALQREAKKTQALAHPNIIAVFDFDRDGDLIFITMEALEGSSLLDILRGRSDKSLSHKDKIDIIKQVSTGLSHAHSKGLVHSDLKPANIFLTRDGTVKILDFGIARAANQEKYADNFDPGTFGAISESYASLEMWESQQPDPSDDVYALGIIAYELLGGAHPYKRKSSLFAFNERLAPSRLRIANPFIKRVLQHAIELKRENRIADAKTFRKKFSRAKSLPRRIASACAIVTLAIIANLIYLSTIDTPQQVIVTVDASDDSSVTTDIEPANTPDAANSIQNPVVSALPDEVQARFDRNIEDAGLALELGDVQTSAKHLDAAYTISPAHPDVAKGRQAVLEWFKTTYKNTESPELQQFLQQQITLLNEYLVFESLDFAEVYENN
jgi:serine/threonine protein kinase